MCHLHSGNFLDWSRYILRCIFVLFFLRAPSLQEALCSENSTPFNRKKTTFLSLRQRTCLIKIQKVHKRSKFVYQKNRTRWTLHGLKWWKCYWTCKSCSIQTCLFEIQNFPSLMMIDQDWLFCTQMRNIVQLWGFIEIQSLSWRW